MNDRKRKLLKIIVITGIVLVVLTALYFLLGALSKNKIPEFDYEFYIPAADEDFLNDPEYLEKDRNLHYTDKTGQMIGYTDEMTSDVLGHNFFALYFFAVEHGDHELLNSLYSEEYLEEHGKFEPFTPQRVYAKDVIYYSEEQIDDSTFSITYSVDYNIMKNDGSFRRDIGSDMSRTQYFTVHFNTENAWIVNVKTEYRMN